MTWKDRLLIIFSVIILLLAGACIAIYKFYHNPAIVFEWKGDTTPTTYADGEDTTDKYLQSPIWIDGKQRGRLFDVTAGDAYKHASRTLAVDIAVRHHVPMITYAPIVNLDAREFRHQLTGQYLYNFGPVAIGGGLTCIFKDSKLYDIGPVVGLAVFIK